MKLRGKRLFLQAFLAVTISGAVLVTGNAASSVTILNPPAQLSPGQNASLNVQFSKDPTEVERRIVLRIDLHQVSTGAKISGIVLDNAGAGYTQLTNTLAAAFPVPMSASGSCYFKATLAPWSLNKAIVAHMKTYPIDGTFTYLWGGGGYGVTQNVYYLGSLIAPKPSGNTCYCSGLAFEACIVPFNAYNVTYGHSFIGNINTASKMETFRRIWYGVTDADKLAARAIPEWGAGREITDFEEAQEGDFVQLWRTGGSGHNPLFVNWVRDGTGKITRARYWGTQGSTNGIGYSTETFSDSGGSVMKSRFYLGRVAKPRDQADYDWAIAQSTTQSTPSNISSNILNWWEY